MTWDVLFHDEFELEFNYFPQEVQDELLARVELLKNIGPNLSRPYVDTLNGSNYTNMKEIRFNTVDGVWRVAFAFDPNRQAIVLVAGDKGGVNEKLFYKKLISKADQRFESHLRQLKKGESNGKKT